MGTTRKTPLLTKEGWPIGRGGSLLNKDFLAKIHQNLFIIIKPGNCLRKYIFDKMRTTPR